MDEQQTPAPEAGDDVVRPDQGEQSEATENTEGQEQDPPADDEGETPEQSEDEVSKSKARRERRKARMEALEKETRQARDAQRKAEEQLQQIKEAAQSAKPPKQDDYSDYDTYLAALAAHQSGAEWDRRQTSAAEKAAQTERERLQQTEARRKQQLQEMWSSQVEDAKQYYSDFDAVVKDPQLTITEPMADMIMESDVAADVAYWLGTNKQEAARIARIDNPVAMARELGRIEASVTRSQQQRTTSAPDPIKPTRPKASAVKDPAKMTMDEYRRAREAGQI